MCARMQAVCGLGIAPCCPLFFPVVQARPSSGSSTVRQWRRLIAARSLARHKSDSFYRGNIALFSLSFSSDRPKDRSIDRPTRSFPVCPSKPRCKAETVGRGRRIFSGPFHQSYLQRTGNRHYGSWRTPPRRLIGGKGFATRREHVVQGRKSAERSPFSLSLAVPFPFGPN